MNEKVTPEAFFTRQRSEEGIVLPLTLPDGTPTVHSIRIRGIDSDAFKFAEAKAKRSAMALASEGITDEAELQKRIAVDQIELLASLIISWTFEMECTHANIVRFLREAPQIADEVNSLAARRRLFFSQGSTNSASTPAVSLS